MHELSIVEALVELCEDYAAREDAAAVREIYVKIGRLSGIELGLFERCFETFRLNSPLCKEAQLFVELAPLEIACLECGGRSILEENVFRCPLCGGEELKTLQGEELTLMRLVMQ